MARPMIAALAGFLAKSALMQSPIGAVLYAIGRFLKHASFWQLVSIGLGALLIVQHFQLADARHDRDAWENQYRSLQTQAETIKRQRDEAYAKIAAEIRKRTDEENRRIAGSADDLRVSGPGRSRCSQPPAASGRHGAPGGNGNAPGPQVPATDSAAVPWQWLVNRAEQADLNRAEVLAWRDWYQRLAEQWKLSTIGDK